MRATLARREHKPQADPRNSRRARCCRSADAISLRAMLLPALARPTCAPQAINLVPRDLSAVVASVDRKEKAQPWPVQHQASVPIVGRGAAVGGRFRLSVLTCGEATVLVRGVARIVWPAPTEASWPPATGPLGGDGVVTPFALAGHGVLVPMGPALGRGLETAPDSANSSASASDNARAPQGFRWVHTSPAVANEPALLVMEAASHALLLLLWLTWTLVPGCSVRTDAECRAACGRCAAWVEGPAGRYRARPVLSTVRPLEGFALGRFQQRSAAAEAVVAIVAVIAAGAALARAAVVASASAGGSEPEWVLVVALMSSAVRPLMLVASSLFIGRAEIWSGRTSCCGTLAMIGGAALDMACGLANVFCRSTPLAAVLLQTTVAEDSCSLWGAIGAFVSGVVGTCLAMASQADLRDLYRTVDYFNVPLKLKASHLRTLGILVPAGQAVGVIFLGFALDWRSTALGSASFAAAKLAWWGTLLFVVRPDPGVAGSGLSSVLADCLQPGLRAARASKLRGFADGLLVGVPRLLCRVACGACCCCYSAHGVLRFPGDIIPTRRSGGHGGYRGWKLAAASGELGTLDAMLRSGDVMLIAPAGTHDGDTG